MPTSRLGCKHSSFFALSSLDSRLLLKIPRRRSKAFVNPVLGEDETRRLCEYNANMAVIGTPHLRLNEYTLSVWNLVTGELTMGNISWDKDITAMSITGPTEWAILSALPSEPPPNKTTCLLRLGQEDLATLKK